MIWEIDIVVRLVTVGASLLLAVMVAFGDIRARLKFPLSAMLVGVIGYLLNSAPQFSFAEPLDAFVDLASLSTTFFIWLFARRLFEREPDRRVAMAIIAVFLIAWFIGHFLDRAGMLGFYILHFVSLAMVADIVITGWSGRSDDLIERRRLIRLWLPLLVGLQAGTILLYETITGGAIIHAPVQLASATLILAMVLFAGVTLMRPDAELLSQTGDSEPASTSTNQLSPSELVLQEKLDAAMDRGFYRTAGLTIAGLADHLGTPEHRLRALINQRLGHRNFSAFLNRHRIAEARAILSDKAHVDLPVLSIAMDLGYNSLPTFNRAFRAETGITPTDYRRSAIGQN